MKRDMDLIRELLRRFEAGELRPEVEGRSMEEIAFHVHLMAREGGLVRGWAHKKQLPGKVVYTEYGVHEITWAGYDFLDASRSDTFWRRLLATVGKHGGAMTFDLLKKALEQMIEGAWRTHP